MNPLQGLKYSLLTLVLIALCSVSYAQTVPHTVCILVKDSVGGQPLVGVQLSAPSLTDSILYTSPQGGISLQLPHALLTNEAEVKLSFSRQKYSPVTLTLPYSQLLADTLEVSMMPTTNDFPDLIVESERTKYNPVGNPAVALISKIVQGRQSSSGLIPSYSYRKVEQQTLALSNFDLNSKFLNRAFPFFYKYLLPSKLDGRMVLPLSVRETVSDMGYNSEGRITNEVIRYRRHIGVDQNIDDGTMTQSLEEIFPKIDLNADYIELLNNRFISPLSSLGKRYYKYYLTDTVVRSGEVCHVVDYFPFNPHTLCFKGRMYLTLDSIPQLVHNDMQVPPVINLNFVDNLRIIQDFTEVAPGLRRVKFEQMQLYLSLYHRLLSVYSEQDRIYDNYDFVDPDSLAIHAESRVINLSGHPDAERYGAELKRQSILASHQGLRNFLEDLRGIPKYKLALDGVEMISKGYIRTRYNPDLVYGGSAVDIGNVFTFLGKNSIEGQRVSLGARTTGYFSGHLFLDGHVAYGFRDKKWKHRISATLSIPRKRYYRDEFPKQDFTVTHEYDLFTPGQIYNKDAKDNILFNLGTSYLTDRSYRDKWQLEYRRDWLNGMSILLQGSKLADSPTGSLRYIRVNRDNTFISLPQIHDTGVGITFRYAPGERVYEGTLNKYQRIRLQRNVPIFTAHHHMSLKVLEGEFFYNKTELSVEQRLWMGPWGRLDYKLTGGKIWNNVPYPMLYTPPVNTAHALNEFAFQLMQPLEYIADEYLTLFTTYHMKGLILNRVPLVRKWGLREVVSFNWCFGNTTPLNRQSNAKEIFILPHFSTEMERTGYAEVGMGIENIFRVLRLDLYHRITPPGVYSGPEWGVKGQLVLDF